MKHLFSSLAMRKSKERTQTMKKPTMAQTTAHVGMPPFCVCVERQRGHIGPLPCMKPAVGNGCVAWYAGVPAAATAAGVAGGDVPP